MNLPKDTGGSLLAVFTQFWRTEEAYSRLSDTRKAGLVMIAAVVVIAVSGYLPAMLINWEEVQAEWTAERMPELISEEDISTAQADSVIAGELEEIREMTGNLPMARLVERGVIALLAALAAFGIVYAVEGRKVGRVTDYLTSSVLAQSAYMLTGVVILFLLTLLDVPPSFRLNLSAFVPVDVADPSRLHVFIFRFLESVDIPSVICLLLWGTGLAGLMERDRSWGIRLTFSVYIVGILLISLPVMFAPAA